MANLGQFLAPVARLLHGAHETGLRVIAYQDQPGGDGLTRFLAGEYAGPAPEQMEVRHQTSTGEPHIAMVAGMCNT